MVGVVGVVSVVGGVLVVGAEDFVVATVLLLVVVVGAAVVCSIGTPWTDTCTVSVLPTVMVESASTLRSGTGLPAAEAAPELSRSRVAVAARAPNVCRI